MSIFQKATRALRLERFFKKKGLLKNVVQDLLDLCVTALLLALAHICNYLSVPTYAFITFRLTTSTDIERSYTAGTEH